MAILTIAVLAGAAVALLGGSASRSRLRRLRPAVATDARRAAPTARWPLPAAAASAGAAATLLVGGTAGLAVGALLTAALVGWLHRLEPAAQRRRRERLAAALPLTADLVATCLEVGLPVPEAVGVVGGALGGAVSEELGPVAARWSLGAEPAACLASLDAGPLGPLGRTLARSARTGASPVDGLRAVAAEARAAARAAADARARSVGTRAAAPLGLCFLPAFVLLGVVPLVVGLARQALG